MPSRAKLAIPHDPLDWRPQVASTQRRQPVIKDPILEPQWTGRHVLAHFDVHAGGSGPPVRLIDEYGEDATDEHPEILEQLTHSILAVDAVLDGYLTAQATQTGEGSAAIHTPRVHGSIITPRRVEMEVEVKARSSRSDRSSTVAFVAIDVLRLDGQALFDLPLLERKRLLDGLVQPTELVRISPYTRPPVGPWLTSWKSNGFPGAVSKAANSRYRPDHRTDEWTVISKVRGR